MRSTTHQTYESPELVELGDYTELTLGYWGWTSDGFIGGLSS